MVGLNLLMLTLIGAVQVTSEPSSLVSGAGASARIAIQVSGASAGRKEGPPPQVTLTTSVGTVSDVRALGGGRFEARLHSPTTKYPQVALILAEVRSGASLERGWLSVPLHGTQTLKLKTKPGARVEVEIAGLKAGAATANATGNADVQVHVPPGVTHAQIRSVDRLGNRKVKDLFLDPPPFARLRFAPVAATGASWSDAAPLLLELFSVTPEGKPANLAVNTAADSGQVLGIKAVGPGVSHVQYRAPERYSGGLTATVRAWPKQDRASDAQAVSFPLRGGPPKRLALSLSKEAVRADAERRVKVTAEGTDEKGNPADFTLPLAIESELGTATLQEDGYWLEVPERFEGRQELVIRARLGGASQAVKLKLLAGAPALATTTDASFKVRAGESERVDVRVQDAFGNPVLGATLAASTSRGERFAVRELGSGEYGVEAKLPDDAQLGETTLEVRSGPGAEPLLAAPLVVLPQRRGSIFVGAMLSGHHNLGQARGGGLSLLAGARPTRYPLELLATVGAAGYPDRTMTSATALSSVSLQARARALHAGVGARLMLEVTGRVALHVGGVAGLQRTWSQLALASSAELGDYKESQVKSSVWARAMSGVSTVLGPGRALLEVQGSYAAPGGQLGPGNVGGLAVGLGYEVVLR